MMVDRGSCTFVTKVRNAQKAGAQAVIVVDTTDDDGNLPVMGDDGTSGDIVIPSMLIGSSNGTTIKATISTIIVAMTWVFTGNVDWLLWTSCYDPQSVEFKSVFGDVVPFLFGTQFTPHYFILNGTNYGCTEPTLPCGSLCTNEGRYCAVDPYIEGVRGSDVVIENLRQRCIFQVGNYSYPEKWWDYVSAWQTKCGNNGSTWTQECSDSILKNLGVDSSLVSNCIDNSGGTTSGPNPLLEMETASLAQYGVFALPTVLINSRIYRGNMSCPSPVSYVTCGVLGGICSAYGNSKLPCVCTLPVDECPPPSSL